MEKITILGAGGKMGARITDSLLRNGYHPCLVENDKSKIPSIDIKDFQLSPLKKRFLLRRCTFALPDRLYESLRTICSYGKTRH